MPSSFWTSVLYYIHNCDCTTSQVCFCTNPVWLVKTRMQLQSPLHQAQPYSGLYGLPSVFHSINNNVFFGLFTKYWPFIVFWIFSNHWILSLRFCKRSLLRESLDDSLIDKIPGRQTDRKTLLGELNWIFTAVTDTIAWNVLPHGSFQIYSTNAVLFLSHHS